MKTGRLKTQQRTMTQSPMGKAEESEERTMRMGLEVEQEERAIWFQRSSNLICGTVTGSQSSTRAPCTRGTEKPSFPWPEGDEASMESGTKNLCENQSQK